MTEMTYAEALKVLELSEEDAQDVDKVKKVYRKLSMQHHPDTNKGSIEAEIKFKQINEAKTVVDKGPQPDVDPFFDNNIFNNIFRGGMGMGGFHPGPSVTQILIDPEILLKGGSFDYRFMGFEHRGNNVMMGSPKVVRLTVEADSPVGLQIAVPGGNGHTFVQLLPGNSNRWTVVGQIHLRETHKVDVFKAMKGGELEITSPRGKKLKAKINPGTQYGTILRLQGHGLRLPPGSQGTHGDLQIQVIITIPTVEATDTKDFITKITKAAKESIGK